MPAVKWLLVLNFVFFCLQLVFEKTGDAIFQQFLQLNVASVKDGWFWQFLTCTFLHTGPWVLIGNLLMLYFFGNPVEAEMGSRRFLQVYFLGAVFGNLLWYAGYFSQGGVFMGASGGVYAITVAFAALFPGRPITILLFFVLPVTLLARYWAIGALAMSALLTLNHAGQVGSLAHLGGALVGYLYVTGWNRRRQMLQVDVRAGPRPAQRLRRQPLETIASPFEEEDFMARRIDPILDKIAEHGIQSLTREERRLLEQAKDRLP